MDDFPNLRALGNNAESLAEKLLKAGDGDTQILSRLNSLPDKTIETFVKDFSQADDILAIFAKDPDLIKAWDIVANCGDANLAKLANNLDELDVVAKHLDEIDAVGGYKVWRLTDGVGTYSTKIKWGIHNVDARPHSNKGYWGKRIKQSDTRVESYELKINPNNESFYVEHPNGGFVQFENLSSSTLQDGKLILQPNNSFYHVYDKPPFLRQKVLDEAIRQVEAASVKSLTVEWLVSDQKAMTQLTQFFSENNVNIIVKFFAEQ